MNRFFSTDICFCKAPFDDSKINPLNFNQPTKAVVIGGGSGAPISIRTLLALGFETSAVVAMADDGGSTGELRRLCNCTPPGDIRNCLAAFADDPQGCFAEVFQTRFEHLDNHSLGNLIISTLEDKLGFEKAIEEIEGVLHAKGHVYPSTLDKIYLSASTKNGEVIHGQSNACKSHEALDSIWLDCVSEIHLNPKARNAILAADIIVLGPGSLFTSILPNIVIPGMVEVLSKTSAKVCVVCPLFDYQGETKGMSVSECLKALERHGLSGYIDYAFVHVPMINDSDTFSVSKNLENELLESGVRAIQADFADSHHHGWHNMVQLAQAITQVAEECHLLQK